MYYYRVFGMNVQSEIEFPELVVSSVDEWARDPSRQVKVELGIAPKALEGPKIVFDWVEAGDSETLFHVRGRGKIHASHGKQITVEVIAPDKLIELRPYMITCGFVTLSSHRKWIPLHVGAVRCPAGVILFCGESGAGKSTTTAALAKQLGWDLLADDIVVLEPSERPEIHIGVSRIKLWSKAAEALDIDTANLEQDFFRPYKYHAIIKAHTSFAQSEVIAVFRLVWGDEVRYEPKSQAFAFQELVNSLYPPFFRGVYVDVTQHDANLRRFFPLKLSGVLLRDQSENIENSLRRVANLLKQIDR